MPLRLEASCRCGAVRFTCHSHTPVPYQRCYCSICRKVDGGGGYAINLGAQTATLKTAGRKSDIGVFRAEIRNDDGSCELSSGERHYCRRCGTMLWLFSPEWPELIHPFASAIDSELPEPPSSVHLMLRFKANWVQPHIWPGDAQFDLYPAESLEDWHKRHGLWVA